MLTFTKNLFAAAALAAASLMVTTASHATETWGDEANVKGRANGTAVVLTFEDYSTRSPGENYYNFTWNNLNVVTESNYNGPVVSSRATKPNYAASLTGVTKNSPFSLSSNVAFNVASLDLYNDRRGMKYTVYYKTNAMNNWAHISVGDYADVRWAANLTGITSLSLYATRVSGTGSIDNLYVDNISTTVVPLPGALPLLGSALVLAGVVGRRLRARQAA
ncbi:hypothetical protein [Pararhodospirillum oryzae]|uniref:PEP-CTERM protein-sorting domain-containing protein n=1 Tax=Pararhodospirillum oryzae TaxID=478448 RepID=A0A512H434_9PROT|nr:hypothetical protein [Pararhodospirillum oryzae]GEO80140.1 hypothetical protein ROR02_02710 [Pararhodospirillum oryzae]